MRRYFWDSPVEDNAFFLLRGTDGKIAQLHASWSEWKNTFSFELYGRKGKLEITGLGGSYGVERLAHYAMSEALGPPETFIYEYPMADDSWEAEFAAFLEDIALDRTPDPTVSDAQAALTIVEQLYAREGLL
jgi:predicted dehydrogenase